MKGRDQLESQAPEPAGVRRAVAVLSPRPGLNAGVVSREQPHLSELESTGETSSVNTLISAAKSNNPGGLAGAG